MGFPKVPGSTKLARSKVIYLACHSEHLRIFEVPNQGVENVKLQRYIIIQPVNPRQLRRPHALDKMQEAISKMELENMEVIGGRPRCTGSRLVVYNQQTRGMSGRRTMAV